MNYYSPENLKAQDFYDLLERRFVNFGKVIAPDGHLMHNYVAAAGGNIGKIRNILLKVDPFQYRFWGYGINRVSDGKLTLSNSDLTEVETTDVLNRHLYYDNFNFMVFYIKGDYFHTVIFKMMVGRCTINSETSRIHLSKFREAKQKTEHMFTFVTYDFEGYKPVSFQIDPYLIPGINYSTYYISTMENMEKPKDEKSNSGINISAINTSGNTNLTIANTIDRVVYQSDYGITEENFNKIISLVKSLNAQKLNEFKNLINLIEKYKGKPDHDSYLKRARDFLVNIGVSIGANLGAEGFIAIGAQLLPS